MTTATNLQIRAKGVLTLPVEMRRKYGLEEGAIVTLIDLGDGSFLLTPAITQVDKLGDRVARAIREANVSEEELLAALDEERERYYQQRYVQD